MIAFPPPPTGPEAKAPAPPMPPQYPYPSVNPGPEPQFIFPSMPSASNPPAPGKEHKDEIDDFAARLAALKKMD